MGFGLLLPSVPAAGMSLQPGFEQNSTKMADGYEEDTGRKFLNNEVAAATTRERRKEEKKWGDKAAVVRPR
jgi:hypothetical protein